MPVVMQKAQLFGGTIRSNLLWGNKNATDADLWAALETAQAADFVCAKPLGLDEPVEQGGRNLSGGQKQRLTIARALVGKPEILILDEVLSVGDAKFRKKSEKKIMSMFDSGVTVLFVSHSLEQVQRLCNKAMILEKGKLIAYGDIAPISEQYSKMIGG